VIIDRSKASMTSVFLFGVRSNSHFYEIRRLMKFLQPILDCEAEVSFKRIFRGMKDPLKGDTCRGVCFLSW
jgi:hypothetical protein